MKNFKVKCIESGYGFEKEKLYEVKDGNLIDDDGDEVGKFESVEEINEYLCSQFELVEEEKKTPFQYLLDYYDIIVGEVFLLNGHEVYFNVNGCLLFKNNQRPSGMIDYILDGTAKVEKLPWKPKTGDTVWKIGTSKNIYPFVYKEQLSSNLAMLKLGWIFPTKEEAEANKERVLAEMKEVLNGTD